MVFTIARNKAVDARRKKNRAKKIGTNETDVTDLVFRRGRFDLAFDYKYANEEEKLRRRSPSRSHRRFAERQRLAKRFRLLRRNQSKNKHRLVAE